MFRRQNSSYKAHRMFFLLGVMVLIGLFLINLTSAATYFEDDFNRANSATVGNGWDEFEGSGTARIDNNTANLSDTGGSYVRIKNNFSTQTKGFQIDYEIYPTSNDQANIIMLFGTEANYNAISIYLNYTGQVMYRDSVGFQSPDIPTNYEGNTWYTISVKPDTDTDTFDLYFNDTLICDDCDLRVAVDGINWTEFSTDSPTLNEFYVDNVIVQDEQLPITKTTVDLHKPTDNQGLSTTGTDFNVSITAINSNLSNVTYYLWNSTGIFNATTINLNGTANSTEIFIDSFELGTYTWNALGCNVHNNCSFAENNYTFTVGASIIADLYDLEVFETDYQRFETNISIISGSTLHSSALVYNGTSYSASTRTISSNASNIYRYIDIPLINGSTTNTFYWKFSLTQPDGTIFYQNTSTDYQNVSYIHFIKCNSTINSKALNFTTKSATNPLPLINTTFYSNWYYWLGSGNIKKQYAWENTSAINSNYQFCISPNLTYYIDADIEYDAADFAQNYYYFDNASISNKTQSINLYLVNDSLATVTTLQVIDQYQNEQPEITIQIQQYDIGLGTYYTIGIAKTDSAGEDIAYLNWYDTFYKFILIEDGNIIQITEPTKIKESPVIFQLEEEFEFEYDKFDDVTYSLYYNNATNNFVLTFADTTGSITQGCLRVIRRQATSDTVICDDCEESTSATLYCNINTSLSGTYLATFYATGSPLKVFASISQKIGSTIRSIYEDIGNLSGSFLSIIMAGFISALFLFNPVLAIVGILAGLLIAAAIGFTTINYVVFIGLTIVGGIIAWAIRS